MAVNELKKAEPFLNEKGQLEIPHFMSPDQARDMLQHRLDSTARKLRKLACTNAVITVKDAHVDEKSKAVYPGDIQYDKDHCQNDRRHGSRFCQKCADERLPAEPREKIAPPKRVHYSRKKRKQANLKKQNAISSGHKK